MDSCLQCETGATPVKFPLQFFIDVVYDRGLVSMNQ